MGGELRFQQNEHNENLAEVRKNHAVCLVGIAAEMAEKVSWSGLWKDACTFNITTGNP